MIRSAFIALTFSIWLVAGCRASPTSVANEQYSGMILGDWPDGTSTPLRVLYGKHWAIGNEVIAGPKGEFQVPSSANIVVAYIDYNHNGQLDRFAEPSGDC